MRNESVTTSAQYSDASTGSAPGQHRDRGQRSPEGLRRPRADRQPVVHVAPQRHRGCHRPQRCRQDLSLIHISEPTRRTPISYAVFCLKKKKNNTNKKKPKKT